jgi:hypothetical protein
MTARAADGGLVAVSRHERGVSRSPERGLVVLVGIQGPVEGMDSEQARHVATLLHEAFG